MSKMQAVADELGLTMTTEFVPFSKSRHAVPDPKLKDLKLNWRVTFSLRGREVLSTDYMQGVAHAPSYKKFGGWGNSISLYDFQRIVGECETGLKHQSINPSFGSGKLTPPTMTDVLKCLLNDATVLEFTSFESWAGEYDYDPDSRRAEAIYKTCLNIGLAFNAAVGPEGIARLNKAIYEDQNG